MNDIDDLKFKVFDIFQTVRENFDGSEYQQGKKDGLRLALAQMGEIGLARTMRGGDSASPYNVEGMDVGIGYVATLEANANVLAFAYNQLYITSDLDGWRGETLERLNAAYQIACQMLKDGDV